ncbi:MAG: hypothetical protein IJI43_01675 [Bacilli bacterium]|nr:hypothetical protein [Bacilli bacterium]
MTLEYLISLITIVVTLVLGIVSKKSPKIKNNLIPIQNLLIGVIVAIVEWILTKDFNTAIALSGLIAGGTYDIVHNLQKLK